MSRCIIVLGLPRSGTSAVAGTLHRMGVDMGAGHLQAADALNPRGYYEDLRWQSINKMVAGCRYAATWPQSASPRASAAYRSLIEARAERGLWGFKTPRACYTLHLILPPLSEACDVRMIAVQRALPAVIRSLHRHSKIAYGGRGELTRARAEEIVSAWDGARLRQIDGFCGPIQFVDFVELLRDPVGVATGMWEFAVDGLDAVDMCAAPAEATDWLSKDLNHCDNADHPNT